jgi:hypothetical protein
MARSGVLSAAKARRNPVGDLKSAKGGYTTLARGSAEIRQGRSSAEIFLAEQLARPVAGTPIYEELYGHIFGERS